MRGVERALGRGRVRGLVIVAVALAALVFANTALAQVPQSDCDERANNKYPKILECIRLDQVREHQAALQEIADENDGNRFSGFSGYNDSVDYVVETLEAAGYDPRSRRSTTSRSRSSAPRPCSRSHRTRSRMSRVSTSG